MVFHSRTVGEGNLQLKKTPFPDGLVLAWNSAIPHLDVKDALLGALRSGVESERMVFTPLLATGVEVELARPSKRGKGS
jgi:hypothetical protein